MIRKQPTDSYHNTHIEIDIVSELSLNTRIVSLMLVCGVELVRVRNNHDYDHDRELTHHIHIHIDSTI